MLDSWQIGEIKVTRILEMEMPLPYRADTAFMPKATPEAIKKIDWLFPHYVTEEGFIKLAFQVFLVEATNPVTCWVETHFRPAFLSIWPRLDGAENLLTLLSAHIFTLTTWAGIQ